LGFTHFLTKTREGKLNIIRTPSVRTRERFLRTVTLWMKANKHEPVWAQQAHLKLALNGYYQYFGLRLCQPALNAVYRRVRKTWQRSLARRSQKAGRTCNFDMLDTKPWFQLPRPRITKVWV
ncbi:MAG TPA: hypothetical protein VF157_07730, partial [Chloroflexota bacterium]